MTEPPPNPGPSQPPRARGAPGLGAKLVLCAVACLVALAVAEGALHLLGIEIRADRLARDPMLGWRNRPGWVGAAFRVNSRGFLGPEFSPAKPAGAVRVFCLGDSTTAGDLLPSYDDTYPRQLERLLQARCPDRPVEVVNAGVGGYSSFQGRRWLETEILDYEPDVVVLYFGWNDHWPARLAGEDKVACGSTSERLRAWLAWSKLLQLSIRAYHTVRGRATLPREAAGGGAPVASSSRPARVSLADYEANLRAMVAATRRRGGEAVLVTAPNYLACATVADAEAQAQADAQAQAEALVALHERYNHVARRVANDTGACLVDAASQLEAAADAKALFWDPPRDFIHLSAQGYGRLARAVADCPALARALEGR